VCLGCFGKSLKMYLSFAKRLLRPVLIITYQF
jgi:hypothetical protein